MCSPVRGSPSKSGILFPRIWIYLGLFLLQSAIQYYAATSQYLGAEDQQQVQRCPAKVKQLLWPHAQLAEVDLLPSLFNRKKKSLRFIFWMTDRMSLTCVASREQAVWNVEINVNYSWIQVRQHDQDAAVRWRSVNPPNEQNPCVFRKRS